MILSFQMVLISLLDHLICHFLVFDSFFTSFFFFKSKLAVTLPFMEGVLIYFSFLFNNVVQILQDSDLLMRHLLLDRIQVSGIGFLSYFTL